MTNCNRPALAVALAAAITLTGGCGSSVSPTAFEHAKSLYTVSNMRSPQSVALAAKQIDADHEAGLLTNGEANRLHAICEQCRDEKWKDAQAAAQRMMEPPPKS